MRLKQTQRFPFLVPLILPPSSSPWSLRDPPSLRSTSVAWLDSAALLLYITVKSSRVQCSTAQEHHRSGRTVLAECSTRICSIGCYLLPSLGPIKGVGNRRRLSGKCGAVEKRLSLSMSRLWTSAVHRCPCHFSQSEKGNTERMSLIEVPWWAVKGSVIVTSHVKEKWHKTVCESDMSARKKKYY